MSMSYKQAISPSRGGFCCSAIIRKWAIQQLGSAVFIGVGQPHEPQTAGARMTADRVIGVQGYAGTGKTTMLKRLRVLGESRGYRTGSHPRLRQRRRWAPSPGSSPRPCNASSLAMPG